MNIFYSVDVQVTKMISNIHICSTIIALTKLRTREGGAGYGKVKEKVNMATPRWCCHMSVIKCLTSF